MFRSNFDNSLVRTTEEGLLYPVYVNSRVVSELIDFCKSTYPKEALAFLLGVKTQYKNDPKIEFTRVVDFVTGSVESTHISATFTSEGLQQANLFLDDKFGKEREKTAEIPKIVGIVHSHPFGFEPHFSTTDLDSFLNFPYDAPGNVFILIDPVPLEPYFKVFKIIINENKEKILQFVPWVEYTSIQSDYEKVETVKGLQDYVSDIQSSESEDSYTPPKIEDLGNKKQRSKKGNVKDFFS